MKLPNFFKKSERYLVVELLPHGERAILFELDEERTVSIRRIWTNKNGRGLTRFLRALPKVKYPMLLLLDAKVAATIPGAVHLLRERAERPIDEAELENLIFQAVWRFFDHYRPKAMERLDVNDLDLLLANIRVLDVRLDGHHVFNPLGFSSKTVTVVLEQTFVARHVFETVTSVIPKHMIKFVTEDGVSGAHVLARTVQHKKFVLGNLFPQAASLYVFDRMPTSANGNVSLPMAYCVGTFPWGEKQLLGSLMDELRVECSVAKAIMNRYIQKDLSPQLERRIGEYLNNGVTSLLRLLKSNVRLAHPFYLNAFYYLPIKNAPKHDVSVEVLNLHTILEQLGFSFNVFEKSPFSLSEYFLGLAALIEYFFTRRNEHLDRFAKRRARWLIP